MKELEAKLERAGNEASEVQYQQSSIEMERCMSQYEHQMALAIGRVLAMQAGKQAALTARRDLTLVKLEVSRTIDW